MSPYSYTNTHHTQYTVYLHVKLILKHSSVYIEDLKGRSKEFIFVFRNPFIKTESQDLFNESVDFFSSK